MLLFIGSILVKIAEDAEFQYTSCYSLSSSASCFSFLLPGFNTSHVTLYRCKGPRKCPGSLVSIHLMLLFIFFSTSLANVLAVSIHLMLLFITSSQNIYYQYNPFQYISCYSLSVNILILFLLSLCFNTSHVTLYLIALQLVLDV